MILNENNNGGKNKRKVIIAVVLIVLLTNAASFSLGSLVPYFGKNTLSTASGSDSTDEYDKLLKVQELIDKYYYQDVDDSALVEGAMKGMASSLDDPYTVYMTKEEYEQFNTGTSGTYVGVGLQVGIKDDKITVIAPMDDSPAKKAGIISGDVITAVDGTKVSGNDLELAVSMMKGTINEDVTIDLFREGKGDFQVVVTRAEITLHTVKSEMLSGDIGYIQLTIFDENSGEAFKNAAEELKNKGMKGLVLDLRGNPGGLLTSCVEISSQFIPKGKVIVSTKDKAGKEEKQVSKGYGLLENVPLVVLTDEGTASASEILSGVVRDYKIGTLIGTKTFGKGVVQAILDGSMVSEFKDGTALKVTISKYYTPNGENIDKVGINPDIEVAYPEDLKTQEYNRDKDPQFGKALEVLKEKLK